MRLSIQIEVGDTTVAAIAAREVTRLVLAIIDSAIDAQHAVIASLNVADADPAILRGLPTASIDGGAFEVLVIIATAGIAAAQNTFEDAAKPAKATTTDTSQGRGASAERERGGEQDR